MPTVTLSTKVYNNFHLKNVDKFLKSILKGLKVQTEILGVTTNGWVQIAFSGEDESVALRYLAEEIGLCPTSMEHVKKFSAIKGRITAPNKSKSELYVDVGVFSPNIVDATIPLQHLQAQLIEGRRIALKKLIELFGFCENLPIYVKIHSTDREKGRIEAMLLERQLTQYRDWVRTLLDRLMILGASQEKIKFALKKAGCDRDVVNIEPLGLLEYAVVCKLGTDAAGLIPRIGKNLRNATFSVFNPREILGFLGEYFIS